MCWGKLVLLNSATKMYPYFILFVLCHYADLNRYVLCGCRSIDRFVNNVFKVYQANMCCSFIWWVCVEDLYDAVLKYFNSALLNYTALYRDEWAQSSRWFFLCVSQMIMFSFLITNKSIVFLILEREDAISSFFSCSNLIFFWGWWCTYPPFILHYSIRYIVVIFFLAILSKSYVYEILRIGDL